jgi:hypothetical protein
LESRSFSYSSVSRCKPVGCANSVKWAISLISGDRLVRHGVAGLESDACSVRAPEGCQNSDSELNLGFDTLHQRLVGREDAWTRTSLLDALGVVRAAQGRTDEAETAFADALAIIEPTMYTILTNDVRASLESLRARATTPTQP